MGNLSVEDQIKVIDKIIIENLDLRNPLELHKMILQAQKQLRDDPRKGTSVNWDDKSIIEDLQKNAREFNQPIAKFLNPSIFDSKALLYTCEQVVKVLIKKGMKEDLLKKFLDELINGKTSILDSISATLKGDAEYFERYGERLGVNPALILFIVSALIQPCLEEIAKKIDSSFFEKWWQALCPVCGRRPMTARLKSRKRYLICSLCGAEYLADLFLCVNCGNIDPATLKFLALEGYPEFRVDFCEKCKHYLKVIDEDKLKRPIPKGLEDVITIDLDFMAKNAGLIRV
ncbi:MAG: formate dehydrogenase accessory protein FdhE [archaeon]|nr:formate dehydrogenase accessory protein FdhE [archaeon]MCP8320270.1 formate dehydrogenase accessory protein FdhE [archaeon]